MNDYYSDQNQQTLNLASASAQEFSGLVLYNFEEVLVPMNCKTVLSCGTVPFFQILKFEYGSSRVFTICSLILKKKKVMEQLYY